MSASGRKKGGREGGREGGSVYEVRNERGTRGE